MMVIGRRRRGRRSRSRFYDCDTENSVRPVKN